MVLMMRQVENAGDESKAMAGAMVGMKGGRDGKDNGRKGQDFDGDQG